jgi:hypothetical protein
MLERHVQEQWTSLKSVLDGVSFEELRLLGVEALRKCRARTPGTQPGNALEQHCGDVFQLHGDLGVELIRLIVEKKQLQSVDINGAKDPSSAMKP